MLNNLRINQKSGLLQSQQTTFYMYRLVFLDYSHSMVAGGFDEMS